MTSLLDRNVPGMTDRGSADPERLLPTRPRSRRQLLAAASAVVIVTSIAGFMSLYSSARREQQVVVVTRTIEQGQIFSSADLGQANASLSHGVQAIPVSLTGSLSGKRAAVTVPAGSLLVPGDVTSAPAIPPGDAVVGIALKDGQYPSTGVQPGGQVMVVQTASPGSPLAVGNTSGSGSTSIGSEATTGTGVLVPEAPVFDVTTPGADSGGTLTELVSVEVPTTLAAAVSNAAAADQVSLVLLPDVASGTSGVTDGGTTNNGGGSQ
jgi:Chaperone for flagella basal body P-ring formation